MSKIKSKGICPFCNYNVFQNSWGRGNALCVRCNKEFNVGFDAAGNMFGVPPINYLTEDDDGKGQTARDTGR